MDRLIWPDGKDFAFTVFDDTDVSTLENVREVYSFLADEGFKITKSVWPIKGKKSKELFWGKTCGDEDYLKWLFDLKNKGFEIGYHTTTFHSSLRNEIIKGIEKFKQIFGHYPKSMANHHYNEESIYSGGYRLSGLNRSFYNLFFKKSDRNIFRGHVEGDKYFWGDICKKRIKYVRNFAFSDINTLKICPIMPYHDSQRPYVNYWFASSEGADINFFNKCISEKNQDRLEKEGGACIMSTHFAKGFYKNGVVNPRFKFLMKRLSKKNGWFVPVSTMLDYLLKIKGCHNITDKERNQLERKWLFNKIMIGKRDY